MNDNNNQFTNTNIQNNMGVVPQPVNPVQPQAINPAPVAQPVQPQVINQTPMGVAPQPVNQVQPQAINPVPVAQPVQPQVINQAPMGVAPQPVNPVQPQAINPAPVAQPVQPQVINQAPVQPAPASPTPTIDNMNQIQPVIQKSSYKLTLTRPKSFVGSLIKFNIFVDGQNSGTVKNGETLELDLTPGNHTISVNQKNEVNINITTDLTADVRVISANNISIINIRGEGVDTSLEDEESAFKRVSSAITYNFYISIACPLLSILILMLSSYYISYWVYCVLIGIYCIDLNSLGKLTTIPEEKIKKQRTKVIAGMIICGVSLILTAILVF